MAAPYDRYFDYKVFELFRDRLAPIVNKYMRDGADEDIYRHIFIAPESLSKRRSFSLKGVISPFICIWPLSMLDWNKMFYGRSVLTRTFKYEEDGEVKYAEGFLYDMSKQYCVYASSYFASFVQEVNSDLLDADRLRYFSIDCGEMLTGFSGRAELMPASRSLTDSLDEKGGSRHFTLAATYDFSVTFPVLKPECFIDRVEIYLNENKIYETVISEGD